MTLFTSLMALRVTEYKSLEPNLVHIYICYACLAIHIYISIYIERIVFVIIHIAYRLPFPSDLNIIYLANNYPSYLSNYVSDYVSNYLVKGPWKDW